MALALRRMRNAGGLDRRHDVILVVRELEKDTYKRSVTLHRGQSVSPAAFPDVQFKVEDLLG